MENNSQFSILNSQLKRSAKLVEGEMRRILNARTVDREGYSLLKEAMEYSVFAGGKRVRPYLCLEFCRVFGGDEKKALAYAAAAELMHTASLIHDDLPAMDDDDLRRGRPSNHKVYGEYTALLAGDALMIESLGAAAGNPLCGPEQNMAAVSLLARASGFDGMCGGQMLDLYCEKREASVETVEKMHLLKTAALIQAAAQLGCIAANASEEETENAGLFARETGLAFQIIDDILDVTSTGESLGKTAGKDAAQGKSTYVSRAGMAAAEEEAARLTRSALARTESFGGESGKRLRLFCEYLLGREN